jgi:small GTP-binding protein
MYVCPNQQCSFILTFQNYSCNSFVENEAIQLGLWDTSGRFQECWFDIHVHNVGSADFNELRPLSYPGTDAFIVCFSIIDPQSLKDVKEKWHTEIRQHCPTSPIILVGTKLDLRTKKEVLDTLKKTGRCHSMCL